MYKLTNCPKCGTEVFAEGCCGSKVIHYNCPCAEQALKEIEDKNRRKQEKK